MILSRTFAFGAVPTAPTQTVAQQVNQFLLYNPTATPVKFITHWKEGQNKARVQFGTLFFNLGGAYTRWWVSEFDGDGIATCEDNVNAFLAANPSLVPVIVTDIGSSDVDLNWRKLMLISSNANYVAASAAGGSLTGSPAVSVPVGAYGDFADPADPTRQPISALNLGNGTWVAGGRAPLIQSLSNNPAVNGYAGIAPCNQSASQVAGVLPTIQVLTSLCLPPLVPTSTTSTTTTTSTGTSSTTTTTGTSSTTTTASTTSTSTTTSSTSTSSTSTSSTSTSSTTSSTTSTTSSTTTTTATTTSTTSTTSSTTTDTTTSTTSSTTTDTTTSTTSSTTSTTTDTSTTTTTTATTTTTTATTTTSIVTPPCDCGTGGAQPDARIDMGINPANCSAMGFLGSNTASGVCSWQFGYTTGAPCGCGGIIIRYTQATGIWTCSDLAAACSYSCWPGFGSYPKPPVINLSCAGGLLTGTVSQVGCVPVCPTPADCTTPPYGATENTITATFG